MMGVILAAITIEHKVEREAEHICFIKMQLQRGLQTSVCAAAYYRKL